jgi:hypothetical protein
MVVDVHLGDMLKEQAGVCTRQQLHEMGASESYFRAQIAARRWQSLNDSVICTHNGSLTATQQRWAAVLTAQPPVALASLTALECWGVAGLATADIHILVRRGARVSPLPPVKLVVHESRRFDAVDVLPRLPPITTVERATIDAAVWSLDVKTATRVICAPVQQRLTTPGRIGEELTAAGQVKFRGILLPFIADLEGGAEALSEVAFLRWCRRHGFPKPHTRVRYDHAGRRRYLDATFRTADGRTLFVEIDGGIHLTLTTRWLDTAKDNDAVIANQKTLRFPSIAIYADDPRAIAQLRAALGSCQKQASL